MPTPTGVTWSCDPHTLAKHDLLRRYLEAWYPILMQSPWTSATYIEGFAGPGVYKDGEPGSPIVAVDVFLRRRKYLDEGKQLRMVLVEEQAQRLDSLKIEMAKAIERHGEKPPTLLFHYQRGECDKIIRPVLSRRRDDRGPVFA